MTALEIPAQPTQTSCASCLSSLVWLWSGRRKAWIAFVPDDCGAERAIRPHLCQHAQDPVLWRNLPTGDPPSAEYLEYRNKSAPTSKEEA